MSLYWMITIVLALNGAVMAGLTLVYYSPFGKENRIRDGKHGSANAKSFKERAVVNAVFSLGIVYGMLWLTEGFLYDFGAGASALRIALEGIAILLLYDFFYYFLHRYPFHQWKRMKRVHAIHHIIRNPSALDSLYLHPLENFLGLVLVWFVAGLIALVAGPVHVYSFVWAFGVYSVLNVVVHAGIRWERFPLNLITYAGIRHDLHHKDMRGKNFASVTPIWDRLLGTEEG